jgi:hypothetical protein
MPKTERIRKNEASLTRYGEKIEQHQADSDFRDEITNLL